MADEFQQWKQHFVNQARGLIPHQSNFYRVSEQKGRGDEQNIKMVAPTQQIVARAKSSLANPPVVYDPVTGITKQPPYENKKQIKRKRKAEPPQKPKKAKKEKKSQIKHHKKTTKSIQKGKGNGARKEKVKGKKKQWWEI